MTTFDLLELIEHKITALKRDLAMLKFQEFCLSNSIDQPGFLHFVLNRYYSGWQIMLHNDLLRQAWREYLSFTYMKMIMEVENG